MTDSLTHALFYHDAFRRGLNGGMNRTYASGARIAPYSVGTNARPAVSRVGRRPCYGSASLRTWSRHRATLRPCAHSAITT